MEFEIFHNDLLAALNASVPLEMGDSRISRLTQSKLERFRETVVSKLGDSPDLETIEQVEGTSREIPARYLAALRTYAWTDLMSPVLDGLTNRVTSTRKVQRLLGQVFLYLFIVMAVALIGLVVFYINVAPLIQYVREDLLLPPDAGHSRFDFIAWTPAAMIAVAVLLVLALVWIALGGATRTAMWLGGRQYVRCWSSATAIRIMQLLIDSGMGVEDSIQVSYVLAGVDSVGTQEIRSAIGQGHAQDAQAMQVGTDKDDLRSMANYMLVLAQQRLEKMRFTVPVLLVTLIGGLLSLAYSTAVFSTIVNLLWDLKLAGTN